MELDDFVLNENSTKKVVLRIFFSIHKLMSICYLLLYETTFTRIAITVGFVEI